MDFQHSPAVWAEHPTLAAGTVFVVGVDARADVGQRVERFAAVARDRLAGGTESDLPEIQAWRRTFTRMGLKPTQYRCAAEALLRRFRKEGALPRIHPLIDLCNAVSLAYAVPIAAFDVTRVDGGLEVRHARGDEVYLTFAGETEHPEPGEVIFADAGGRAHARRWSNRQSGHSAVRDSTTEVLIVAEALHETAADDVAELTGVLVEELGRAWPVKPDSALLSAASPRFSYEVRR
ncbi:B3/4 domain-containing protein [Thermoactinospora rubra]|uniref:B3/B4 domain-containing protein n=1 Tax=Thermoactinospora rubra TaxID=1088767 RepID=UPI000A0F7341|nr:phenylalanine--tRNA ligase beta subunit-related protein [Thermoactinospora rubra]